MAERPPATDLRGGKASADSFTRLMANLVVAYAVGLQSDLLTGAALGSTVWSEDFWWSPFPTLKTDRNRSERERRSVLREKVWLDRPLGAERLPYLLVLDREWPRDWALAESRYQSGDLGLIPWDAVLY